MTLSALETSGVLATVLLGPSVVGAVMKPSGNGTGTNGHATAGKAKAGAAA